MVINHVNMEAPWLSTIKFANTITTFASGLGKARSLNVVVHNYKLITINQVENYICNGHQLSYQPKIYDYNISNSNLVTGVYIEFKTIAVDDYALIRITSDRSKIELRGGEYQQGEKIVSGYYAFGMNTSNLRVEIGAVNTETDQCNFSGGFILKVYY